MSLLYQVRPSVLARWPEWELDLIEQFLAKEPGPADRVERAVAKLTQLYAAAHSKENTQHKLKDFLPYLDVWPADTSGRYNEVDQQVLAELL